MSSRPRVVVVGANFAGLTAARHLPRALDVTVVDAHPWFEWLPNVHELVSGIRRPESLRAPRARLVRTLGHRFVCARVVGLDARRGRVELAGGRQLPFDACVVAVGGVNDTFGVPGADRHAWPFKSVEQCAAIGRRLATLVAGARPVSVVVVGGGLEGVEALGEILRRYRRRPGLTVHLVEAARRLVPGTPPAVDRSLRAHCAAQPVRLHLGQRVTRVLPREVRLGRGRVLASDLTIWTGGATAAPLLAEAGLAPGRGRWAPVRPTLQSERHPNVIVAGDAAALPTPLDKQAYYAMQMGAHAAETVLRVLRGEAPRPFQPAAKPMLLAFGDLDTYLVAGRLVVAAPALALLKEAVFQVTMAQIDPPATAAALGALERRLAAAIADGTLSPSQVLVALARLPALRVWW